MPLYFFHIKADGHLLVEDQEGGEYPDIEAALQEAWESVRSIVADGILSGRDPPGQAIGIFDRNGQELDSIRFVDVLSERLRHELRQGKHV